MPAETTRCPKCSADNPGVNRFCAQCGSALAAPQGAAAKAGLQWKWVLVGAAVVFAVQFGLGILMAIAAPEAVLSLGTGDVTAGVAVVVLLLFFGGYFAAGGIVALLSPGLTLREPAIGAALAVAATNVLGGNIGSVLLAWIIPFAITLLGAKVGERIQSRSR